MGGIFRPYDIQGRTGGLFDVIKNKSGKGVAKPINPNKGKYPINEIIEGKHPDFPLNRLQEKLIRAGIKKNECEQCGYKEQRITDGKIPLLLAFDDGNKKNHRLENVKLLCHNCIFTTGRFRIKLIDKQLWETDSAHKRTTTTTLPDI